MDPLVTGAIVLVLAIAAFLIWQQQRTHRLHQRYGPEYTRAVGELGRRRAEVELAERERRVAKLNVRALTPEERERFATSWRSVQARFVDDPAGAVTQADQLLEEVMVVRGYPSVDFDRRVADLSVHHAGLISNYRDAHAIADRHRRGEAGTEELRQAMVYYRSLFVDLLEDPAALRADRVVEREVVRDTYAASTDGRTNRRRPDGEVRP